MATKLACFSLYSRLTTSNLSTGRIVGAVSGTKPVSGSSEQSVSKSPGSDCSVVVRGVKSSSSSGPFGASPEPARPSSSSGPGPGPQPEPELSSISTPEPSSSMNRSLSDASGSSCWCTAPSVDGTPVAPSWKF